jgi:hypothetical protein
MDRDVSSAEMFGDNWSKMCYGLVTHRLRRKVRKFVVEDLKRDAMAVIRETRTNNNSSIMIASRLVERHAQ